MKCPACPGQLHGKRVKEKEFTVDQCDGCRGIWFDNFELSQVLGHLGSQHREIPRQARRRKDQLCPRCQTPLYEYPYPGTTTKVNTCADCSGTWLDAKELGAIRESRTTNQAELISCPRCRHEQLGGAECRQCGVIFSKVRDLPRDDKPIDVGMDRGPHSPVEDLFHHLASHSNLTDDRKISGYIGQPGSHDDREKKLANNRKMFCGLMVFLVVLIPLGYSEWFSFFAPCEHYGPSRDGEVWCMTRKSGAPWEVYPIYYSLFLAMVGALSFPFAWQMHHYKKSRWKHLK